MEHRALYRTYRPATFSQVVGQEHITTVLRYAVKERRTSHAYLFCGSRGTGKTSCAKILAKAINCLDPRDGDPCCLCENCRAIENGTTSDVIEMDAASNTGVDYIRDIRDEVMYAPSMLRSRVYIIDEVHMLSDGAFNALLKTLEEPPANVVFILATTEMQKIPATILSRCQRFEFRRIATPVIAQRLRDIAQQEKIELDENAATQIARAARGGMRDAISLLETCAAGGERVDGELVRTLSGGAGRKTVEDTLRAILKGDGAEILSIVARLYASAGDIGVYWQELIEYYRDMMVCKTVSGLPSEELRREILDLTEQEFSTLRELSSAFRYETLLYHSSVLDAAYPKTTGKTGMSGRIAAETALLRMTVKRMDTSPEALASRIAALEEAQMYGVCPPSGAGSGEERSVTEQEEKKTTVSPAVPGPAPVTGKTPDAGRAAKGSPEREEGYEPLPGFEEILHEFYKAEPSCAAFMEDARAYQSKDQTKVVLLLGTQFALTKLSNNGKRGLLSRIIAAQTGVNAQVEFRVASSDPARSDPLGELY